MAFFTPRLSRLWLSLITGQSLDLVGPLVESLRHEMVARDREFQLAQGVEGRPWRDALTEAYADWSASRASRQRTSRTASPPIARRAPGRTVRSVQRLPRPTNMDAREIGSEYLRWLPRVLWPVLVVEVDGPTARFRILPMRRALLQIRLSDDRSTSDRALFYVEGGLLAVAAHGEERMGRLEFRLAPDGEHVLAALHDFVPSLPWFVYRWSQALVHLWVMRAFGRHLARRSDASDTS